MHYSTCQFMASSYINGLFSTLIFAVDITNLNKYSSLTEIVTLF